MWQGADCKFESCDKTQYMTELYNNKPVTGIWHCLNYEMIHAALSRKKSSHSEHNHADESSSSSHTT